MTLCVFQSTLPARGATHPAQHQDNDTQHFNPRSPHGERPCRCQSRFTLLLFQSTLPARGATMSMSITIYPPSISIHAPRTGSDDERGGIAGEVDFNPRSPHGERHTFRCWLLRLGIFQSTLPARGATRAAQHQQKCNLISIHAPRTGSDCSGKSAHLPCCDFNPRSPHGERRTRFICSLPTQTISIHAPRTGSDQSQQPVELRLSYFNPRSPHGERPTRCDTLTSASYFNPRSPHGERLA